MDETASLGARVRQLAVDKAHLQLVIDMMRLLNKAPGLENTLRAMMHAVLANIGGGNTAIYYVVDQQIYRARLSEPPEKIEHIDDPEVADVFRGLEPVEIERVSGVVKMTLAGGGYGWSLAYPLKTGDSLIGVFKIDNLHVGIRSMEEVLPVFFEYAAVVLKNEILDRTQLQQANDKLTLANAELLNARDELEQEAQQRTATLAKLAEANAALESRTVALEAANAEFERTNRELEQANKELESFSYSMSHDLQTPLRAIDGFSRLVLENCGERLGDENRAFLIQVRKSVARMAQLINDLLAFFRVTRRKLTLQTVDMTVVAKELALQLQFKESAYRSIDLKVAELPPTRCNEELIRQVFMGLIGNAIKFTASRSSAVIEVGGTQGNGENIYWIKDNGVGFNTEYGHKLFCVFERLHSAGEFEGTGMGLAIVKRIIDRHGGRVWAESKVGEGATFYFALPERVSNHSFS